MDGSLEKREAEEDEEGGLNREEMAKLFFAGVMFFPGLFLACMYVGFNSSCGRAFRDKYHLQSSEVLDICNKAVSSVQAAMASGVGVVAVSSCRHDLIYAKSVIIEVYAWFGFSYFFYDTISMYYVYKYEKAEKRKAGTPNVKEGTLSRFLYDKALIVVHHLILSPVGFAIVVHYRKGLGDCLVGFLYLMEFSTPFVSLRSVLSKMKMKSSPLYVVNGLVMIVAFFTFRLMIFLYIAVEYAKQQAISVYDMITSFSPLVYIMLFLLIFPQVYWFVLMVNGAVKIMITQPRMSKKAA